MSRIVVIEDEHPMRVALVEALTGAGHRVQTAVDGVAGLDLVLKEDPDLVLLDVMMPSLDGFSLCRELRRLGRAVPVLMLTARAQTQDRIRGLDLGADDYLVKPFSLDELLARIRALLRRGKRFTEITHPQRWGDVEVDFARCTVSVAGRPVRLTAKELSMLRLLVEAEGEVVSRERFLDVVWGVNAFPTTRTVDNHIASLRSKLERDPAKPTHLKTVHGLGYRLQRDDRGSIAGSSMRSGSRGKPS